MLAGNFRVALYLDEGTSDAQHEALVNLYSGKLGGPVAELAKLVGEVVSVERAPIRFDVNEGRGTLTIGDVSHAELEPYKGPDGSTTVLSNTIFSTVPGAPVFVGKATRYTSKHPGAGARYRPERPQRAAKHVRVRRLRPRQAAAETR